MEEFKLEIFTLHQYINLHKWMPIKYHRILLSMTRKYKDLITSKYKGRKIKVISSNHQYNSEIAEIVSCKLVFDKIPTFEIKFDDGMIVSVGSGGFVFI